MKQIAVVRFDPGWLDAFELAAKEIISAFGRTLIRSHHIGSTAVPGMHAKPVIDILAVVSDLAAVDQHATKTMESLGYEAMGEFGIAGRRYFRRDNSAGVRTHQIHVFENGSPHIQRHLAFRDYLRAHPDVALEYADLKQRLAEAHPNDIEAYMDGKDGFIKRTEADALAWRADPVRFATRKLANAHLQRGDAFGWFDELYRQANGEAVAIPWADLQPNPHLVEWLSKTNPPPRRALVIGCGLGDDAAHLASLGWSVVAFDISPEAIRWARQRFAGSSVDFRVVDLFKAPSEWHQRFDMVVEAYTLQALPPLVRTTAVPLIADWVALGGLLLLIARGRDPSDPIGQLPWPLTEREVRSFESSGLIDQSFEDFMDRRQDPPLRRFRAVFRQTD